MRSCVCVCACVRACARHITSSHITSSHISGSHIKVLLQIEKAKLKKEGKQINPKEEQELLTNIQEKYNKQISPYYAAARLWTDAIIDPKDTRKWISMGIDAANNAPQKEKFNMGVLQV